MRSVVLDGPDSWAQTMAAEGLIEKFVGLDFADADTVYNRCVDAIQSIKKVPNGLEAAHTLPHPPTDAALTTRTSIRDVLQCLRTPARPFGVQCPASLCLNGSCPVVGCSVLPASR